MVLGMPKSALLLLLLLTACATIAERSVTVPAREMADPDRGRLLYQTACAACHTEQAHWREKSVVKSWDQLVFQVARWQKIAGQPWRTEETEDVAAYLNRRFYHLSCPLPGCAAEKIGLR
jgi:mono/diheme cytochrome c family protein